MGNSKFKSVKLCLKIDLVSHPARAEGLVNTHIFICIYIYIEREREKDRDRERERVAEMLPIF